MTQWYYADRQRQQQGPINAAVLAAALANGEVSAGSLVWREGLPGWVPLAEVAAELGLEMPAAPPRPAVHRAAAPPRAGSTATWIVVAAVVGFGLIGVLGIILAISIPAYNDYTTRARVSAAIARVAPLKAMVAEHFEKEGRCPGGEDEGFEPLMLDDKVATVYFNTFDNGSCGFTLLFLASAVPDPPTAQIQFAMDADGIWTHTSTLSPRHLPASMR